MIHKITLLAFVLMLMQFSVIAQPGPPPPSGPEPCDSSPFGPFADTLALTVCANCEVTLSAEAFTLVNADYYIYEWSNGEAFCG
jgi:hypothetical protein